ncbi:hypothetical protein BC830DRAFT_1217144 [Chytriomyces sp. MP71]|nr:hypothetical protein BC830DRAFT_1217144 [Chytriomyces sp. MP71]
MHLIIFLLAIQFFVAAEVAQEQQLGQASQQQQQQQRVQQNGQVFSGVTAQQQRANGQGQALNEARPSTAIVETARSSSKVPLEVIQGPNGIQGISGLQGISRREEKTSMAEEMANDPGMQEDVADRLEMLMEHTQDLANASEIEAKEIMCGTAVESMLQSNMASGEDLIAMTNCATAKSSVFIPDDELNQAADATSTANAFHHFNRG